MHAHAGIDINGGYGDVTGNTLIDADGGIVLDSMTNPPAPTTFLLYDPIVLVLFRTYNLYSDTCCWQDHGG